MAKKADDKVAAVDASVDAPVAEPVAAPVEAPVEEPVAEVSPRELRWEAFLVEARKVNPERFDRQQANREFATIPDTFF